MKTIIPSGYPTLSLKGLHEFNKTALSLSLVVASLSCSLCFTVSESVKLCVEFTIECVLLQLQRTMTGKSNYLLFVPKHTIFDVEFDSEGMYNSDL